MFDCSHVAKHKRRRQDIVSWPAEVKPSWGGGVCSHRWHAPGYNFVEFHVLLVCSNRVVHCKPPLAPMHTCWVHMQLVHACTQKLRDETHGTHASIYATIQPLHFAARGPRLVSRHAQHSLSKPSLPRASHSPGPRLVLPSTAAMFCQPTRCLESS
jgi:hypothetical protein